MDHLNNSQRRKQAIEIMFKSASYCLNLKTDKDQENVFSFLNAFFSMQGPEFFNQLNHAELLKSYAGAICDLWKIVETLELDKTNNISVNFCSHAYNPNLCFLNIVSKDCSYILKTFQHVLRKNDIAYKNSIYPVIYVHRDEKGKLIDIIDVQENDDVSSESIIQFLIVTPLSEQQKKVLEKEFFDAYQELLLIHEDEKNLTTKLWQMAHEFHVNAEESRFLKWIHDGRYYCYGYRYFAFQESFEQQQDKSFGLLKDPEIFTHKALDPVYCEVLKKNSIRVVKSSLRSNINRASRYDCIEIPEYNKQGKFLGLHQFIGVFTPEFFTSSPLQAPLASQKAQSILERFGYKRHWFSGRLLTNVMSSISLDLFFQLPEDEIAQLCQMILEMQKNIVTYVKPSIDNQYVISLIYMPMEKYSFPLKEKIKKYLEKTYEGNIYSEHVLVGEYSFARVVFVVDKSTAKPIDVPIKTIEEAINLIGETWEEKLDHLIELEQSVKIAKLFPDTYKESFSPQEAIEEYVTFLKLSDDNPYVFDIKQRGQDLELYLFSQNGKVILSDFLPILEKFGVQVFAETTYPLAVNNGRDVVLQVFDMRHCKPDVHLVLNHFKERFLNALAAVWQKKAQNDSLNALILLQDMTYRDLMLVRTYIKAQKQTGIQYSYEYIVDILCAHHDYARKLFHFFTLKFDPKSFHVEEAKQCFSELETYCNNLEKRDDDRILRGLLNLVDVSLRTNFYQYTKDGQLKDYTSVKFDSKRIMDLPKPAPLYEIFVYSTTVEGVHLRSGKVARGGLRWSDRLEDFRSEVLGLMKAQIVKNSVIVPFGSKGGFVVKNYEEEKAKGTAPAVLKQLVVSNYQTFISGLLDLTDNYINNQIIKPNNCILYDGDDHYLVVAADKGTATFSDVANGVADDYHFWLSDAFASGGSYGYDHKKMGITAKGAWVCVQRHFLEKGIDVQKDSIRVIGVGDMAGDVFGNGMLLSRVIQLTGAFNHEHIFIDPQPEDCEKSYLERERLFHLPGSKWSDYNQELISKGGGIFKRNQKWIPISPEMSKAFDIEEKQLSPEDLIKKMLQAPVDLLFFGGIGTFIKGSNEAHVDVKDKANDVVRVDAKTVRAAVISEGANLGITQKGRIEYAVHGGRINTDAVDNSAGVNCSDYEVNIKIFFSTLLQKNILTRSERDQYLLEMTDHVAELVLVNNRQQSFLLSLLEYSSKRYEKAYCHLIDVMAQNASLPLDVTVENLPNAEDLNNRKDYGQGFVRPELAVMVAYSKLHLYKDLLDQYEDDVHDEFLELYFPQLMIEKYHEDLKTHPLKKEIICNYMTNYVMNHCGILFVYTIAQTVGLSKIKVMQAILKVIQFADIDTIWKMIAKADFLSAEDQYINWYKVINILRQMTLSYIRHQRLLDRFDHDSLFKYFAIKVDKQKIIERESFIKFIDDLYFYPLILEGIAQSGDVDKFGIKEFVKSYYSLKNIFDFPFLVELSQIPNDAEQWERSTQYLLNDELLQKLVKCMLAVQVNDTTERWMKKHQDGIKIFLEQKDIVKRHFQKEKNTLGLLNYLIKQIDLLMREE